MSSAIWVGLRRVIGVASRAFSLSVSMTRSIVAAIQQSALATILSEV
ncbi:TPA: hypothetical protein ACPZRW_001882 [Yersinia enterocolitica]